MTRVCVFACVSEVSFTSLSLRQQRSVTLSVSLLLTLSVITMLSMTCVTRHSRFYLLVKKQLISSLPVWKPYQSPVYTTASNGVMLNSS